MQEQSLFIEALEKADPAERVAFLDQACAGDASLRQRIERLLQRYEQAAGFLEAPSPALVSTLDGPISEGVAQPGTVIGPYKLLEQIGEGGFGVVFMAEQLEPIRRKVALKVLKPGMDTRQVVARFEAERQALALMDHPNIAKVLDAGETTSGRPYFVMELVKGIPITDFCDQNHLTPRQRLELFVPVCQAVQHAHQKGIIHRDLKPSNVLVSRHDTTPMVKVIDFGVAKALGQELTDKTLFTAIAQMIGTPLYMSPEQAGMSDLDVDTRSDIYSLGVLLYELLTGTTPLSRERLKGAAYDEIRRIIREEDPPKPSTRLSELSHAGPFSKPSHETPPPSSLASISAQRQTEPAKLTKLVRGELDWIVMKALEKDRNRRYETANGFAMDVRRYLADEPVVAGPPSRRYRLRKFLRRNKGPALAACLVALVLIAGISGTTWGMLEARRRAEGERLANLDAQEARRKEAERLAQVEKANELLLAIFRGLDPRAEEKEARPLRAILGDRLGQAAAELEGEPVGDPLTVARLQNNLGLSLSGLALYDKAVPLLEKARRTRERLLGADHAETLKSLSNLADAHRLAGKPHTALPLFQERLTRCRAQLGDEHPDTLLAMNGLALAYWETGQTDKAVPLYEATVAKQKQKLGADHPRTLITMSNLAVAYGSSGRDDMSATLLEEVHAKQREKLGSDHADTLMSLHNLGMAYWHGGRREQARQLFEEGLTKRRAALGPDHPDTVMSMNALAVAYRHAGALDKALPLLEETLAKRKARLGQDHPHTLNSMSNLAGVYLEVGQLDQAVLLYEETLAKSQAKLGPDHPDTFRSMGSLALAYRSAGQLGKALPLFEETLAKQKAKLGPDHPHTLMTMSHLALAYQQDGWLDQAVTLFEETLVRQKAKLGPEHPDTLSTADGLADAYLQSKKPDKALPVLRDCLGIRERKQPEAWTTFLSKAVLGAALLAQKNYADAEPLLLAGYQGMKQREAKVPAPSKARLTEALKRLVELYDAWGKKPEADKWRKELETREKEPGLSNQESDKK